MDDKSKLYTRNVKTFVQILPFAEQCWDYVKICDDKKTIYVRSVQDFSKGKVKKEPNFWKYTTDGILFNLNQVQIYKTVLDDSIEKAVMGNDLLIFGFGQTGSGKSTTISGLQQTYNNRGLLLRMLSKLWAIRVRSWLQSKIDYKISFVEVEKMCIRDLLNNKEKLEWNYKNLTIVDLNEEFDAFDYLFKGESLKKIYKKPRYNSNVYTSIYTIYITNQSLLTSRPEDRTSKIHIIDMAGNDSDGNATCKWKNTQQVGTGNLNKTQLELCLLQLHKQRLDGYLIKDSGLLVDYLNDTLKPQSIIKFIAHIRTSKEYLYVTRSNLKLVNIARNSRKAKLTPHIYQSPSLKILKLEDELEKLKRNNYLNSMIMNDDLSYNISEVRIEQIKNAIEDFCTSHSNEIILLNICDAKTCLALFKTMYNKCDYERMEAEKETQELREMQLSLKLPSKISITKSLSKKEKMGSKTSRTMSYESQNSKKRRSIDKSSKYSKQSVRTIKSNIVGTLSKSGISLGQLMSYNYQGSVTKSVKSLKTRNKRGKKSVKSLVLSENDLEKPKVVSPRVSEINLETELGEDFEEAFNSYKFDENYNYTSMNDTLEVIEHNTKDLMKIYDGIVENLKEKIAVIDFKKNDLFKIKCYKESSNLRCSSQYSMKLDDIETYLSIMIIELMDETIKIKEDLLTVQADMKINVGEYHRIRHSINEDFKQFCIDIYNVEIPATAEQISNCIEDKLVQPELAFDMSDELKDNIEKQRFDTLQLEMKKVQKERLKK